MENFTKIDFFATQGIEYLFALGFLVCLILFYRVATMRPNLIAQISETIKSSGLRIPMGIHHSGYHTWTHLEESGIAKIGLDDFIQHVTGNLSVTPLKEHGQIISKGESLAKINCNGKSIDILSPLSGRIVSSRTESESGILSCDELEKGWIFRIKPSDWRNDTESYYIAEDAISWQHREMARFKEFMTEGPGRKFISEEALTVMQDGGLIRGGILAEMPEELWNEFQKQFINI